jgi:hypothetical protein
MTQYCIISPNQNINKFLYFEIGSCVKRIAGISNKPNTYPEALGCIGTVIDIKNNIIYVKFDNLNKIIDLDSNDLENLT